MGMCGICTYEGEGCAYGDYDCDTTCDYFHSCSNCEYRTGCGREICAIEEAMK